MYSGADSRTGFLYLTPSAQRYSNCGGPGARTGWAPRRRGGRGEGGPVARCGRAGGEAGPPRAALKRTLPPADITSQLRSVQNSASVLYSTLTAL